MAPFNIDLAEQPVPVSDLRGLKLVTDAVSVPVEADEAAYSLEQVMILVRERMCDAISLKITKLGGLRNTLAAARICEAGGIRYRMGAHSGPALLAAHAAQLAAALPGIWYASELSEFDGLLEDPWEGLRLVDGVLYLPETPGCGVQPNAASSLPKARAR
jgi:L-alanine-DL-glutamate epimerase-like enolase superfamily enzyme